LHDVSGERRPAEPEHTHIDSCTCEKSGYVYAYGNRQTLLDAVAADDLLSRIAAGVKFLSCVAYQYALTAYQQRLLSLVARTR